MDGTQTHDPLSRKMTGRYSNCSSEIVAEWTELEPTTRYRER